MLILGGRGEMEAGMHSDCFLYAPTTAQLLVTATSDSGGYTETLPSFPSGQIPPGGPCLVGSRIKVLGAVPTWAVEA